MRPAVPPKNELVMLRMRLEKLERERDRAVKLGRVLAKMSRELVKSMIEDERRKASVELFVDSVDQQLAMMQLPERRITREELVETYRLNNALIYAQVQFKATPVLGAVLPEGPVLDAFIGDVVEVQRKQNGAWFGRVVFPASRQDQTGWLLAKRCQILNHNGSATPPALPIKPKPASVRITSSKSKPDLPKKKPPLRRLSEGSISSRRNSLVVKSKSKTLSSPSETLIDVQTPPADEMVGRFDEDFLKDLISEVSQLQIEEQERSIEDEEKRRTLTMDDGELIDLLGILNAFE